MGSMNRGRVATAIVVALLLGTGLLHVAYRLAAPSDHARILHAASDLGPVTVTVAEPLPGGLRTGDRIVSIEGKDLSSARRGPLDLGYPDVIGRDGLTYRVLRDGQPVDLTLARGPYPLFVTAGTGWGNWVLIGLFLGLAIMVVVFAVFVTLELTIIKQLGFGLAVAVFIDATIVRSVLLPATMRLLGDWNWWLPRWLGWLPHVTIEGPAEPTDG